jgi:hypothetical protein
MPARLQRPEEPSFGDFLGSVFVNRIRLDDVEGGMQQGC